MMQQSSQSKTLTLVLHPPLELDYNLLSNQIHQKGLGIYDTLQVHTREKQEESEL